MAAESRETVIEFPLYHARQFLVPSVDSFIRAEVDVKHSRITIAGVGMHDPEHHEERVDIDALLKIGDCHRSIEWSFAINEYSDLTPAEAKRKIQRARQMIVQFEKALLRAIKYRTKYHGKKS